MEELKRLPAAFYKTPKGKELVRDWLKALNAPDRRIVGQDIAVAEYGWPVGMPLCRHLGRELFEVRSNLFDGRIARIILAVLSGRMVLLHAFVKKTKKTPLSDLKLAEKRLKELK